MRRPKITKVSRSEASSEQFSSPSRFYYVNAFFDLIFVHRLRREDAQAYVDKLHGKGKYNIRLARLVSREKL